MAKIAPLILADKLYIPVALVSVHLVKKHFVRHLYKKEYVCGKCDERPMRPSSICMECPNYERITLYGQTYIKGVPYFCLPAGNVPHVLQRLGLQKYQDKIKDIRPNIKMPYKLKFVKRLRRGEVVDGHPSANQVKIIKDFIKNSKKTSPFSGIIEAKARVGKTSMAIWLLCALKRRTIVLVHKIELARQFLKELRFFTNINTLEKKHNVRLAGIATKDRDFKEIKNVVICTYQSFIRPGTGKRKFRKHLRGKFTTLIVDESHKANAYAFSIVVNNLDCRFKIGLSATPQRKDKKEFVIEEIMGPVNAKSTAKALTPRLEVIRTGIALNPEPKRYDTIMKKLANNKDRNKMLVQLVFKILRSDPKRCILLTCIVRDHVILLTKLISQQARLNNEKRNENWSNRLVVPFHGQLRHDIREHNMDYAFEGKSTRVMVAMRSMVTDGNNVPVWTDLILTQLFANPPQTNQLCPRICTAYLNKPQPIIHAIVDDVGLSLHCFRISYFQNFVKEKYIIDEANTKISLDIIRACDQPRGGFKKWNNGGGGKGSKNKVSGPSSWVVADEHRVE